MCLLMGLCMDSALNSVNVSAAIIALFTAFDSLLNLVSVCTLFTFYIIACGILYRRYHLPGKTKPWLALFVMIYFTAVSVGARSELDYKA